MKKIIISIILAVGLLVLMVVPVLAATYTSYFPITFTDTSGSARTYIPVFTGFTGQNFYDSGYINSTGTDTNMMYASTSEPYMMSTTNVGTVIPSLPAGSTVTYNFYTGYSPAQTAFPIVVGSGGYITTADNAALEPASSFSIAMSGYINTAYTSTFPTISAETGGGDAAGSTSHTISLPSGIIAGNLLIITGMFAQNPGAITFSGWTSLWGGSGIYSFGFYKVSDGTEGSSVTITTANSAYLAYSSYRVTNYVGVPEVGSEASGSSANPDPPNLAPSWGDDSTLWIAMSGHIYATYLVTGYPSGYSDTQTYASSGGASGANVGVATKDSIAASENPGTFTVDHSVTWRANTIAVRGSGSHYVFKSGAINIYNSASGSITASVTGQGSVTATTVTSGLHTVTVSLSSGTLSIQIDAGTPVTAASGAVPGTSTDWIIGGNAVPYLTYYKETVSGTEVINYAPTTMLTDTTLPNNDSGGSYAGTITWGSNSDITVSYGAMVSSVSSNISAVTTVAPISSAPMPAEWYSTGTGISNLPFYTYVSGIASQANIPVQTMYMFLIIGLSVGALLLLFGLTKSILIALLGFDGVLIVGSAQTLVPVWMVFVATITVVGLLYLYNRIQVGG